MKNSYNSAMNNQPIQKWAEDSNRHFCKEDIPKSTWKNARLPLTCRKMQIKTTMRIHFRLIRMVIIKQANNRKKNSKCWWGCKGIGTLMNCWWKYQVVWPLWKIVATPWTVTCEAPLSSTIYWSLLKCVSIELMMLPNYLVHAVFAFLCLAYFTYNALKIDLSCQKWQNFLLYLDWIIFHTYTYVCVCVCVCVCECCVCRYIYRERQIVFKSWLLWIMLQWIWEYRYPLISCFHFLWIYTYKWDC